MANPCDLEDLLERPFTLCCGTISITATLRVVNRALGQYVAHVGPDRDVYFKCWDFVRTGDVLHEPTSAS